jgi:hypothetical protein
MSGHAQLHHVRFGLRLRDVLVRDEAAAAGHSAHRRLTEHLLERGVRVFVWSFHTPSLEPGHTPYVRSEEELKTFLDRFRAYFEWFFGEIGGVAGTPAEVKKELERAAAG